MKEKNTVGVSVVPITKNDESEKSPQNEDVGEKVMKTSTVHLMMKLNRKNEKDLRMSTKEAMKGNTVASCL